MMPGCFADEIRFAEAPAGLEQFFVDSSHALPRSEICAIPSADHLFTRWMKRKDAELMQ